MFKKYRYPAHFCRLWFSRFCLGFWYFKKIRRLVMCSQVRISQTCLIISLTREAFQNTWAGRTQESLLIPNSMGTMILVWEILIKWQNWNTGLNNYGKYAADTDFIFHFIPWWRIWHNTLPEQVMALTENGCAFIFWRIWLFWAYRERRSLCREWRKRKETPSNQWNLNYQPQGSGHWHFIAAIAS